jgi:hypothetical protein
MQQQQNENRALPALADREGIIAVADLERSQQAKQLADRGVWTSLRRSRRSTLRIGSCGAVPPKGSSSFTSGPSTSKMTQFSSGQRNRGTAMLSPPNRRPCKPP